MGRCGLTYWSWSGLWQHYSGEVVASEVTWLEGPEQSVTIIDPGEDETVDDFLCI